MKPLSVLCAFSLLAGRLLLFASTDESVTVKGSSVANGLISVRAQRLGKDDDFTCFAGQGLCSAPSPGEYLMVKADASESIYNDCINIVLYKTTSSGAKEKIGVYCWLTSGDCYMVNCTPPQAETISPSVAGELVARPGEPEPVFSAFPVQDVYHGKPALAQPVSRFARTFRTVIREGAKEGPNFAGHFTVVMWGCGTSCAQFAIVDAITGTVYDPPYKSVVGGDTQGLLEHWGLHFELDSRLFIAQGCPEEKNCATRYYRWDGSRLELLKEGPVKRVVVDSSPTPTVTVKP